MNWTSLSKSQSLVRYAFIAVFLLGTGLGSVASAKCKDPDDERMYNKCRDEKAKSESEYWEKNRTECKNLISQCEDDSKSGSSKSKSSSSGPEQCQALQEKIDDAYSKYREKCSSAGLSQSCEKSLKPCGSLMGTEDYKSEPVFLNAAAAALNAPVSKAGDKCSSLSGREYKDRIKDIKEDLKSANKELKDADEKATTLKEDYDKAVNDIDEKIADAQKEYKEKALAAGRNARDLETKTKQALAQARATRRAKEAEKVELDSSVTAILTSKNEQLAQMVESTAVITCYDKAKNANAGKKTNNNVSQLASGGSESANLKQYVYKVCKQDFAAKRLKVIQQAESEMRRTQKKLENLQSEMDNLDDEIAQAQKSYLEENSDRIKSESDAETAMKTFLDQSELKKQQLAAAYQKKVEALEKSKKLANTEASKASTEMLKLDALEPAKKSGDTTMADAFEAKQVYDRAQANYDTYRYKVEGSDKDVWCLDSKEIKRSSTTRSGGGSSSRSSDAR